ncbi:MAG: tRNA epoxyqueuosine(34) reductase QueG [Verrucomicrobia bacterium]|nr:tRNA epoxyqueuosine(34) reductase QueG [Verrucomicrobiota bacterium]
MHRALELGFDACRITTAEPPSAALEFRRWLAARYHGEMAYLERNASKRVNPQEVLADAKTIITLAVNYASRSDLSGAPYVSRFTDHAPRSTLHAPRSAGIVARYARYTDYHDVLAERLKKLAQHINDLGGAGTRSLWYVDTGPLLERDLAQRSGLGFIGKHTNLISRQLGNWFFLAEIITTLRLDPDTPAKNLCGSCARCLAACPTQAIVAPFQLDARRCISYLTIELRGAIPVELRPAMGARIFGCDDCLEVCPWNRFAREGNLMKQYARTDLATPDLLELLALDDAAFKRRFANTPILRTKRRGLLRNVCVALGNVGDQNALPALERAARDEEPLIAEHARWAMEQIQARQAG